MGDQRASALAMDPTRVTMQPHLICWHYPLQIRREFPEFRIYRLWDTPIGKLVILSRAFAIG